ncbi:helix-turn-helix domain-containing protein [Flavobacteriaceae bacterium AU392]|nr:helix-turn-helix domain-containing protein [Flavobacteriaceae bacterium]RKM85814.1 helix-turn-helix domain-containing protein [Flavobacteriaceae bacterium AU392]
MDDRIRKTLDYIENHLSESLSLDQLAAVSCLSRSQFHRLFKEETQRTPFKFIEEIKMNKAYQLLTDENRLVTELASNLGYNDYETFSRAFKKYFHLSPDDLKAISNKVNATMEANDKTILLTFNEKLSEDELLKKLNEIAQDNNIIEEDLKNAKIFKIAQKTNSNTFKKIIKNKFEMTEAKQIWKSLLNKA